VFVRSGANSIKSSGAVASCGIAFTLSRLFLMSTSSSSFTPPPGMMTVPQAIEYSGVSRAALYRLGHKQRVDFRRLGGRSFITRSSLDALITNLPKAPFTAAKAA
jgi:Helix-turn-helix domain